MTAGGEPMDAKTKPEKEEHIDPVCGMIVTGEARYRLEQAGEKYYFCSEHCLREFKAHPELYLNKGGAPAQK
jgi:YHS domain-containing protein